jgi:hypothetical protein
VGVRKKRHDVPLSRAGPGYIGGSAGGVAVSRGRALRKTGKLSATWLLGCKYRQDQMKKSD